MYDTSEKKEKYILVAVCLDNNDEKTMRSLKELSSLLETAGGESEAYVIQKLDKRNSATYVGSGKLEEIRQLIENCEATGIVTDDELTPMQMKNLEDELSCKVLDRTMVILDIFASRASTSEGKLQVELAQLKYRATRLAGFGKDMSRLGGGIGTRGPGEKKIEVDRRIIKDRIVFLNKELEEVKRHRQITRSKRSESNNLVVAIVGYTNAGKSTLLNKLTGSNVLSEDKLFATLDPTTRTLELSNKENVLLTDTVGFISKLPHHLVEAFRSTLEEAKYADIILHVVDASNPDWDMQMKVVYDTLASLFVLDKPIITAFNKQDMVVGDDILKDINAKKVINISAKYGTYLEELKTAIEEIIKEGKCLIETLFPYSEAGKIQEIRKYGELLCEEYKEDGILVKAFVPKNISHKFRRNDYESSR